MVGYGIVNNSDEKTQSSYIHPVTNVLPGFNGAAQLRKPFDKYLSPFMSSDSKPIQYSNGFIPSVCTDSLFWSPGECLYLSNYEGKFTRKQPILSCPVIVLKFE